MYAIRNTTTKEIMEHVDTIEEAREVMAQYNEMGSEKSTETWFNEYYGTYEIVRG